MAQHINPVPYVAHCFGDKLHVDQNEKLNMYGVIHIVAADCYSRKIVAFVTLPNKNPISIYKTLFKPLLQSDGMWNQLRIDHGTEFSLISTIQLHLSNLRNSQTRDPVLQSLSRQNHKAEQIWPEINLRVNYPIKRILTSLEGNQKINMEDSLTKFAVLRVTINIISVPVTKFIRSWNCHRIPGSFGGIYNVLARTNSCITELNASDIPDVDEAVTIHESFGNSFTEERVYGVDPLSGYPMLQSVRERDFKLQFLAGKLFLKIYSIISVGIFLLPYCFLRN